MNHQQSNNDNDPGVDASRKAIQSVTTWVNQRTAQHQRRRKTFLFGGVAVAIVMVIGMTNLTGMVHQIDTDTVAFQGRFELQQRLPEGRAALQAMLEDEAPGLVSQGIDSLVASIPALRERMVDGMSHELAAINTRFQVRAEGFLVDAIREAKRHVDQTHPGVDNQLELVAHEAAERFQADFRTAALDLYPHYAAEMTRMRTGFERLMHSDPAQLTPSERNKRELIETVLLLAKRAEEQNI